MRFEEYPPVSTEDYEKLVKHMVLVKENMKQMGMPFESGMVLSPERKVSKNEF